MLLTLLTAIVPSVPARIEAVNFDDGAGGTLVEDAYAAQGVTFTNARFLAANTLAGQSSPNVICSASGGGRCGPSDAIVAVFDKPVDAVTIRAINVGANGARIEAYDAAAGGALVDAHEYVGTGGGFGAFADISVVGVGIRRIVLFQPVAAADDTVFFDNLTFLVTPPPDATAPTVSASADKSTIVPATDAGTDNGSPVAVTVSGRITDEEGGSGLDLTRIDFTVLDEYGLALPSGAITLADGGSYSFTVNLPASRRDTDKDGRKFTIVVSAADAAGNEASKSVVVTVPHSEGKA
jgi:hypothetical protein